MIRQKGYNRSAGKKQKAMAGFVACPQRTGWEGGGGRTGYIIALAAQAQDEFDAQALSSTCEQIRVIAVQILRASPKFFVVCRLYTIFWSNFAQQAQLPFTSVSSGPWAGKGRFCVPPSSA